MLKAILLFVLISVGIILILASAVVSVGLILALVYYLLPYKIGFVPSEIGTMGEPLKKLIAKYCVDENGKINTEEYTIVETGCGMASVSRFLEKQFQWKDIYAIDGEISIFTVARFMKWWKKSHIHLVFSDIFKFQVPKKALVYSYLTSSILTKMYTDGMLDGQLVISLTFSLKAEGVKPVEIVEVPNFQHKLLVYDFRK